MFVRLKARKVRDDHDYANHNHDDFQRRGSPHMGLSNQRCSLGSRQSGLWTPLGDDLVSSAHGRVVSVEYLIQLVSHPTRTTLVAGRLARIGTLDGGHGQGAGGGGQEGRRAGGRRRRAWPLPSSQALGRHTPYRCPSAEDHGVLLRRCGRCNPIGGSFVPTHSLGPTPIHLAG